MNVENLSEATLDLLIYNKNINEFKDIYALHAHKNELAKLPGLGAKSVEKLLESIEKSRECKLENFIAALGIPNIGLSAAKTISKACNGSWIGLLCMYVNKFDFTTLNDIGQVTADCLEYYLGEYINDYNELASEIKFIVSEKSNDNSLAGMKFCITGSFSQPREQLKKALENKGAKFVSSISKNLDILFCGDKAGSKLAKAQSLGVKVADEQELIRMIDND